MQWSWWSRCWPPCSAFPRSIRWWPSPYTTAVTAHLPTFGSACRVISPPMRRFRKVALHHQHSQTTLASSSCTADCLLRCLPHHVCVELTTLLTLIADIAAVAALQLFVVSLSWLHLASRACKVGLDALTALIRVHLHFCGSMSPIRRYCIARTNKFSVFICHPHPVRSCRWQLGGWDHHVLLQPAVNIHSAI